MKITNMNFLFFLCIIVLKSKNQLKIQQNISKQSFLKIFVKITALMMTPLLYFQNLEFFIFLVCCKIKLEMRSA